MHSAIVAAALLAAGAAAQGLTYDTFDEKCKYMNQLGSGKKGKTAITAWCLDDAGKRWQTTLNLNLCIGNDAGKLAWRDKYVTLPLLPPSAEVNDHRELTRRLVYSGNFDQTCGPCGIGKLDNGPVDNVGLKCNCLPAPNAVPKYTDLAISPNNNDPLSIKLVDGRFVCGPHQGDKVERN
ncbi:Cyanovirin-N [Cordyceps militaris]|uniref:Cyanovirin-N n=1 Tax=Cordyceps militaris TaxID=73501 RepID=A0A2H4S7P4_CORMI|nr:Cyanovirin-N [Cordyceps militaris]